MLEKKEDRSLEEVNSPNHYNYGARETLTKIKLLLTEEEYRGFAKGSYIKYEDRMNHKGNKETDLAKADYFASLLEADLGHDAAADPAKEHIGLDEVDPKELHSFAMEAADQSANNMIAALVEVLKKEYPEVDPEELMLYMIEEGKGQGKK